MQPQRAKLRLRCIGPSLNINLACDRRELSIIYPRTAPPKNIYLAGASSVRPQGAMLRLRRISPLLIVNLACDRSELLKRRLSQHQAPLTCTYLAGAVPPFITISRATVQLEGGKRCLHYIGPLRCLVAKCT